MTRRRILVLQLCRMGDILQTTPVLRRLRRADPESEIHLVVADAFAGVPIPTTLYDRLHVFPHVSLGRMLAESPNDAARPLAALREFVAELGAVEFDFAVSLTPDDVADLLMFLVPARARAGSVATPRRQRAVYGGWMQYFWATARTRALRAFNLVDMYTWAAGAACDGGSLEMDVSREARGRMNAWLNEQGAGERPLVALQLGASEPGKQWPTEQFAAMADEFAAGAADFVLVGTRNERPLAERFLTASRRRALDAVGLTTLPELGALLERCRVLVTNDTGTMHVAVAVGTPVVGVTVGQVLVHETGPYGPGHLIIEPEISCFPCSASAECHHRGCHDFLAPRDAAAVVAHLMAGEGEVPRIAGGRVLHSRRAPSGRIEYVPVHNDQVRPSDVLRSMSAAVWEESLGVPPPTEAPGCVAPPTESEATLTCSPDLLASEFEHLNHVAAEAESAARVVRRLLKASRGEQAALATRAHQHLEHLLLLGEVSRVCLPIVSFLSHEIDAVDTTELGALVRAQAAAYDGAASRASRFARLVQGGADSASGVARSTSRRGQADPPPVSRSPRRRQPVDTPQTPSVHHAGPSRPAEPLLTRERAKET